MKRSSGRNHVASAGLIALGVIAVVLSLLALNSGRSAGSVGEPARTFDFSEPTSEAPTESSPSDEADDSSSEEVHTDDTAGVNVVIVGDSNSMGDDGATWVGTAANQLGWDPVHNLSAPGRGYVTEPRSCDDSPCAPFVGTVDAIAQLEPEVVVTFGGVADGDVPITEAAAQYYTNLREALPDAHIVAVAPIYSADALPDWAPLHYESIRVAVESVGGTFVDAGQPALGDGEMMSAESHAELAQTIVGALQ